MKELGRRVRARRTRLGMTQEQLGSKANRSHSWVVAIEKGTARNPDPEAITAMAVALDEDPAEFLRLSGKLVFQAENVIPMRRDELAPGMAEAISKAVAAQVAPLVERLDQIIKLLGPEPDLQAAATSAVQEETHRARSQARSNPDRPERRPLQPLPGSEQ